MTFSPDLAQKQKVSFLHKYVALKALMEIPNVLVSKFVDIHDD